MIIKISENFKASFTINHIMEIRNTLQSAKESLYCYIT